MTLLIRSTVIEGGRMKRISTTSRDRSKRLPLKQKKQQIQPRKSTKKKPSAAGAPGVFSGVLFLVGSKILKLPKLCSCSAS